MAQGRKKNMFSREESMGVGEYMSTGPGPDKEQVWVGQASSLGG